MDRKIQITFLVALALSLVLHLSAVVSVSLFDPPQPKTDELIEVVFLSPKDLNRKTAKQIIEQDKKRLNDEVPKDTRFLGRHSQQVKKQTKASLTGKYNNSGGRGGVNKVEQTTPKPKKQTSKKQNKKMIGTIPTLEALRPQFQQLPKKDTKNYFVKTGKAASRTNDHLKKVDKGLQTLLSTREFVYYSYYERIRGKIRQHWEPSIREKVRKIFAQGRSIASSSDRITRVMIILNKEGKLITVKVISESGYKDLDDAAIEAFRAAEPFPNPPRGIVETDGTIKIRWDFVLEAQLDGPEKEEDNKYAQL